MLLKEPYASVKLLPFDGHGWFYNATQLASCIAFNNVKTVIEVGCWLGLSTRFIASQLGEGGLVYAVDTWLGSLDEKEHREDQRRKILYEQFLSNTIHAGLTDKIIPLRMSSLEASQKKSMIADLIYIDASHKEEDVFNDIIAWYPHLNTGGILCGDDWSWDSVQKGVIRAAKKLKRKIFFINEFWELI